jgi:ATP-dependent helicase/nuclease subunit B
MQEFQNDPPDFLSNYLSNTTPFNLSIFAEQLKRVGEWL